MEHPIAKRENWGVLRAGMMMFSVATLLGWHPVSAADKTDVVTLENGDTITGEIKELTRGRLAFSTDHIGTVYIEWDEITHLESEQHIEVELDTGEKFFGMIDTDSSERTLKIVSDEGILELELSTIVRLVPIAESRWRQLEGHLDLGLNFASANKSWQYNLNSEVSQRTRKSLRRMRFDSTLIDQEGVDRSKRQSLSGLLQRFFEERRFAGVALDFQENEELGLSLRYLISAGFGRHVIQSNKMNLNVLVGLAENWESFDNPDLEPEEGDRMTIDFVSTELMGAFEYSLFTFDDPETDLLVRLTVFPSLTFSGRIRAEFQVQFRREIVKDFFWGLSLFESYDSQPPLIGLETSDTVLNSSVGWSF